MLPNNPDIEKSVLGSLLMGKVDYIVKLKETDFFSETNKLIFSAMRTQYDHKAPVDEITVADQLKDKLDNALEKVMVLSTYVSTPENIGHYTALLKSYAMRREIIKASLKAKEMAENGDYETAVEIKNDVMQLFDIETLESNKRDNSLYAIALEAMKDMEEKYNSKQEDKLFTGFYDLDKVTAGLHPEEFTIIAARPGVGKTAFAVQLMLHLANKGNKCLFVSREMSTMQIAKRIIANLAVIDGHKTRLCKSLTESDWSKMHDAMRDISELAVELNDRLASIQEIRAYCREVKPDLLIIDYLQLCKSLKKTEDRRREVEDISRAFKEMSLEFKIPIIALSQLSRESVKTEEPELHHLRESGAIEQDADNVIMLHVPKDTDETANYFDIKVKIVKQRNGSTGHIWLRYYRRTFKLCNIS